MEHGAGLFLDDFDGDELDRAVWLPHYLPAWSSRAETAATYAVRDSALHLRIDPGAPAWCWPDHRPATRVSGIQSGSWSGPVGGTRGQQPYRDGLAVREQQDEFWGWTPGPGRIEVRARMTVSPRSMAACWLVGREVEPHECAELCLFEVFGDAVEPGRSAGVGMGLHAFRDPDVPEDFAASRLRIDVAEPHTFGASWTVDTVELSVDDALVRRCPQPPAYPLQMMLAVFDFPDRSVGDDDHLVPELVVESVRGW
ncbi:hypothetical protein Cch01nite_09190 [Cellulomonas chitinilytica]|uniref:Glycoside hydrolase family 16 n=1 Tax=Cellulomonas chitinilytica TaxID=398759 RepID=A0A919TY44_9CELL|nr:glycoside hydrolase family 16 protein [Cellulomonas chitinilytica]GIG20195.1 hypothetical protein Cch01nite_09190 [Cellulomonas chitinilytica]